MLYISRRFGDPNTFDHACCFGVVDTDDGTETICPFSYLESLVLEYYHYKTGDASFRRRYSSPPAKVEIKGCSVTTDEGDWRLYVDVYEGRGRLPSSKIRTLRICQGNDSMYCKGDGYGSSCCFKHHNMRGVEHPWAVRL